MGRNLAEPVHKVCGAGFRGDLEGKQYASAQRALDHRLPGRMEFEIDIPVHRPGREQVQLVAESLQQHLLKLRHRGTAMVHVGTSAIGHPVPEGGRSDVEEQIILRRPHVQGDVPAAARHRVQGLGSGHGPGDVVGIEP